MKFSPVLFLAFLFLCGCASIKEKLGVVQHTPNEFETTKNPPLEIPGILAVDDPKNLQAKQSKTPAEKAQEILKIGRSQNHAHTSRGEKALLKHIQTKKQDADIREKIDSDTREETFHDKVQSTLVFWKKPKKGDVINPHEEAQKLHNKVGK